MSSPSRHAAHARDPNRALTGYAYSKKCARHASCYARPCALRATRTRPRSRAGAGSPLRGWEETSGGFKTARGIFEPPYFEVWYNTRMIKANSIRAKIIENYDEQGFRRLSWQELALKIGTTEKYLSRLASKMSKEGLLPETPEARAKRLQRSLAARERLQKQGAVGDPSGAPKSASESIPDALEGITHLSGAMPRPQRLKVLSDIARNGIDIAKIQAITRLEEMERAAGTSYGPPPPTTSEDMVRLIVELLRSIDPEVVAAAVEELKNEREAAQKAIEDAAKVAADPRNRTMGGRST